MSAGRAVGARSTRQKRAVIAVLERGTAFRSAQDIYATLRESAEPVGLTTVYSQLRTLAAAGEVDAVHAEGGETLYRRCSSTEHHHHVVCRDCGRSVEVDGPAVEEWTARVAAETGFTDVRHTLEITGRCTACSRSPRSDVAVHREP